MKQITVEWVTKAESADAKSAFDAQRRCLLFRDAARKTLSVEK